MATIGHFPPAGENQGALGGIPGARFTEGVVFAVDGDDQVGPEAAGAVLVLQGTLDRDDKAQRFWSRAAKTLRDARESPGFIRFIAFSDGLSNYALGFWRTRDEAMAYSRRQAHREASAELHRTGNQYTHFAGLFTADKVHERHAYCDACGARNLMPRDRCAECGKELIDVFKTQDAAVADEA